MSALQPALKDYNPERNAKIAALRKAGVGPREIARQVGCSPGVVSGVLHRHGLTDPNASGGRQWPTTDSQIASALAYLRDGKTANFAARWVGLSLATVLKIARREGIALRPGRPRKAA